MKLIDIGVRHDAISSFEHLEHFLSPLEWNHHTSGIWQHDVRLTWLTSGFTCSKKEEEEIHFRYFRDICTTLNSENFFIVFSFMYKYILARGFVGKKWRVHIMVTNIFLPTDFLPIRCSVIMGYIYQRKIFWYRLAQITQAKSNTI